MTLKASKLDRLPQITQTLDAELRDTTPTFQEHYQRLHVGLREWWREYTNISNAQDQAGTQNLLINGGFQVWQRIVNVAATAVTRAYSADRWALYRQFLSTGASAARATALTADAPYSLQFYRDPGDTSTDEVRVYQSIPTSFAERFRGKYLALRFNYGVINLLYLTGTSIRVRIITGTGTDQNYSDGSYTSPATILDETISLGGISVGEARVFTATTSAVIQSNVSEITVLFSYAGVGTVGIGSDGVKIGNVQLVPFSDAIVYTGDFKWRSFEDELAACLPYYEKSFAYATAPAQNAGTTGSEGFKQTAGASMAQYSPAGVKFQARKRVVPTMIIYNTSAANAQFRDASVAADWSACGLTPISAHGFWPNGTSAGGSGTTSLIQFHWTADAEI